MSSRERARLRRQRSTGTATAPDEVDGEEPEGDLTVDQTPVSSLDDLTTPADPGEFTQTFTDDDALLDLQGAFDPTAGAKQVIPRIAYTINFNFVWNPSRERWEPDEGNENAGVAGSDEISKRGSPQTIPAAGALTQITYDTAQLDQLGGVDLSNNRITVQSDGSFLITTSLVVDGHDDDTDIDGGVRINGSRRIELSAILSAVGTSRTQNTLQGTRVISLDAGDQVTVAIDVEKSVAPDIRTNAGATYLSVTRLT